MSQVKRSRTEKKEDKADVAKLSSPTKKSKARRALLGHILIFELLLEERPTDENPAFGDLYGFNAQIPLWLVGRQLQAILEFSLEAHDAKDLRAILRSQSPIFPADGSVLTPEEAVKLQFFIDAANGETSNIKTILERLKQSPGKLQPLEILTPSRPATVRADKPELESVNKIFRSTNTLRDVFKRGLDAIYDEWDAGSLKENEHSSYVRYALISALQIMGRKAPLLINQQQLELLRYFVRTRLHAFYLHGLLTPAFVEAYNTILIHKGNDNNYIGASRAKLMLIGCTWTRFDFQRVLERLNIKPSQSGPAPGITETHITEMTDGVLNFLFPPRLKSEEGYYQFRDSLGIEMSFLRLSFLWSMFQFDDDRFLLLRPYVPARSAVKNWKGKLLKGEETKYAAYRGHTLRPSFVTYGTQYPTVDLPKDDMDGDALDKMHDFMLKNSSEFLDTDTSWEQHESRFYIIQPGKDATGPPELVAILQRLLIRAQEQKQSQSGDAEMRSMPLLERPEDAPQRSMSNRPAPDIGLQQPMSNTPADLQSKNEMLENELIRCRNEQQACLEKMEDSAEQLRDCRQALKETLADREADAKKITELETVARNSEAKMATIEKTISQAHKDNAELSHKNIALSAQVAKAAEDLTIEQGTTSLLRKQVDQWEKDMKTIGEEKTKLHRELRSLKEDHERERKEVNDQLAKCKSEALAKEEAYKKLVAGNEANIAMLNKQLQAEKKNAQEAENKLQANLKEYAEMKLALGTCQGNIKNLQEQLQAYKANPSGVVAAPPRPAYIYKLDTDADVQTLFVHGDRPKGEYIEIETRSLQEYVKDAADVVKKYRTLLSEVEQLRLRADVDPTQLSFIRDQLQVALTNKKTADESLQQCEERIKELAAEAEERETRLQQLEDQNVGLIQTVAELNDKVAKAQQERAPRAEELQTMLTTCQKKLVEYQGEVAACQAVNRIMSDALEANKGRVVKLEADIEKREQQHTEKEKQLLASQKQLQEQLNQAWTKIQTTPQDDLKKTIADLQTKLNSQQAEAAAAAKRLSEQLAQIKPSTKEILDSLKKAQDEADAKQAEAQLAETMPSLVVQGVPKCSAQDQLRSLAVKAMQQIAPGLIVGANLICQTRVAATLLATYMGRHYHACFPLFEQVLVVLADWNTPEMSELNVRLAVAIVGYMAWMHAAQGSTDLAERRHLSEILGDWQTEYHNKIGTRDTFDRIWKQVQQDLAYLNVNRLKAFDKRKRPGDFDAPLRQLDALMKCYVNPLAQPNSLQNLLKQMKLADDFSMFWRYDASSPLDAVMPLLQFR